MKAIYYYPSVAPLYKALPGHPQALLISLLTVHLDQPLLKVSWDKRGHLWTGAGTKKKPSQVQTCSGSVEHRSTETREIYGHNTLILIMLTVNTIF